jgi:hypothetical protein
MTESAMNQRANLDAQSAAADLNRVYEELLSKLKMTLSRRKSCEPRNALGLFFGMPTYKNLIRQKTSSESTEAYFPCATRR